MSSLLEIQLNKGDAPDSRNILPAFLGKDNFGLPFTIIEAKHPAIRYGKWKYIPKRKHGHERHVKKILLPFTISTLIHKKIIILLLNT